MIIVVLVQLFGGFAFCFRCDDDNYNHHLCIRAKRRV
jgi:hypothetical protein